MLKEEIKEIESILLLKDDWIKKLEKIFDYENYDNKLIEYENNGNFKKISLMNSK